MDTASLPPVSPLVDTVSPATPAMGQKLAAILGFKERVDSFIKPTVRSFVVHVSCVQMLVFYYHFTLLHSQGLLDLDTFDTDGLLKNFDKLKVNGRGN